MKRKQKREKETCARKLRQQMKSRNWKGYKTRNNKIR